MNKISKIKVLHLRDSPWVCGPGRTIIETGCHLDSNRFDYFIGAFANKSEQTNPFVEGAVLRNLKVFPIRETGSFDLHVFPQILRLIDNNNIDIVHTHEVRSDLFGLICARFRHLPVITTTHGWIQNDLRGKLYTFADRKLLRFFDHVIAVSEKVKEDILQSGAKSEKVTVLHNALVTDNFTVNRVDNSFRKELGAGLDTLIVANIGRLSPEKGQADFLQAAAKMVKYHQDVRFVLIGIGPDKERLEKLIRDLDLGQWVIFAGFRNDMVRIYNSLDLVIQTSYTEGLPNVILESLLMEVPVIATDVGGTAEIVKDGITGILVKPGIPEEVARYMLRFAVDGKGFAEMASAGSILVKSDFTFEKRTKRLETLYEETIENWSRKQSK